MNDFSDKNDWRYYFVKQSEMIDACGSQKLAFVGMTTMNQTFFY
jgi:hypothetical protein